MADEKFSSPVTAHLANSRWEGSLTGNRDQDLREGGGGGRDLEWGLDKKKGHGVWVDLCED
jgi:hypothetical protein